MPRVWKRAIIEGWKSEHQWCGASEEGRGQRGSKDQISSPVPERMVFPRVITVITKEKQVWGSQ